MLIEYRNVDIYQDEKIILKGVNFTADAGEFIYIIGKVGSGKSSLLKTIYGELDIDKDDCEKANVLGYDMGSIKRAAIPSLRRKMGIIFQDFQLLHDRSVYRNLRFVLRATGWKDGKKIDARIDEVLRQVGLSDKRDKMPHELSGGEHQRIAIARALLNKPKMLIADEPTGNLDPETANNIVGLLRQACDEGTCVVMSTHNIQLLKKFPGKIYRCQDGHFEQVDENGNETESAPVVTEVASEDEELAVATRVEDDE